MRFGVVVEEESSGSNPEHKRAPRGERPYRPRGEGERPYRPRGEGERPYRPRDGGGRNFEPRGEGERPYRPRESGGYEGERRGRGESGYQGRGGRGFAPRNDVDGGYARRFREERRYGEGFSGEAPEERGPRRRPYVPGSGFGSERGGGGGYQPRYPKAGRRRPQESESRRERGQGRSESIGDVQRKGWGALTSRGAARIRPLQGAHRPKEEAEARHSGAEPIEAWVAEPKAEKSAIVSRARRRDRTGYSVDAILRDEVPRGLSAFRTEALRKELTEAIHAYEADRYRDAKRHLDVAMRSAHSSPTITELLGLTHYRLGNWSAAIGYLETASGTTGSLDQGPVMADCYRALGRHDRVKEIYDQVGEVSPSAEVMAEARIVYAGSLSDQKDYAGAIKLLSRFEKVDRTKPRLIDLRQWYMLGDLYEKVGEIEHARRLFALVAKEDPSLYDVAERLADLR